MLSHVSKTIIAFQQAGQENCQVQHEGSACWYKAWHQSRIPKWLVRKDHHVTVNDLPLYGLGNSHRGARRGAGLPEEICHAQSKSDSGLPRSAIEPLTDLVSRDYAIRLLTPLFGGGVEPGEPDPSLPIRGASIRGQLRFWWRATCGRLLPVNKMWRREEEIFGSGDFPSPLEMEVSRVQGIERLKASEAIDRDSPVRYALFPAIENGAGLLKDGLTFHLKLCWPSAAGLQWMRAAQNQRRDKFRHRPLPARIREITADIEAALWAWCRFGGLGERTRRGVGAIHIDPLPAQGTAKPSLQARIFVGRASERGGRRPFKHGRSRSGSTGNSGRPHAERSVRRRFPQRPDRHP